MKPSMNDRDGYIWLDGEFVSWRDAQLHFLTHSLHYGMGVFEGVRAYETARGCAVFRLDDHTRRLFNSAKIFEMEIPFDFATVREAQLEVIRRNQLRDCYIRPLVWLGSEQMGLGARGNTVHVGIAAWPWRSYLGEEGLTHGIRVKTSSFSRHHVNVSLVRAKASGYYINSILANREVTRNGYDEALLLDTEGYVSEGAGENVFVVRNDQLYTPDLASCLDGITRASVIQLAQEAGLSVVEKRITRDELYCADEAFFTGTAAEITPIRELDDRVIGAGIRGPVTQMLQARYFEVVAGRPPAHEHWLTNVYG
ncbi:branched-chain amino acid transaminase [Burkholderia sp. Ac-20353]|uniref:branched-chain amino acid transaminase n=1 Tax=Burkholderia sp. Ac-20353 TaxID=2703894 RepID=UPI00197B5E7F|nr:branched-chain amino acid transaminase [Burkholderia sp. Ac-20353]MBN3786507.1 branched-chain amino acid transaminase [Burkholderia sp. Ac-20353]